MPSLTWLSLPKAQLVKGLIYVYEVRLIVLYIFTLHLFERVTCILHFILTRTSRKRQIVRENGPFGSKIQV